MDLIAAGRMGGLFMICSHCGAQIQEYSAYCPYCGQQFQYQNQDYNNRYYQYPQPNPPPYSIYPPQAAPRTAPMILGIIGIIFALLLPFVTYACSIPGLVMANTDIRRGLTNKTHMKILNIVAISLAACNSLLGVVLGFMLFY